jgi:hypothetical protein
MCMRVVRGKAHVLDGLLYGRSKRFARNCQQCFLHFETQLNVCRNVRCYLAIKFSTRTFSIVRPRFWFRIQCCTSSRQSTPKWALFTKKKNMFDLGHPPPPLSQYETLVRLTSRKKKKDNAVEATEKDRDSLLQRETTTRPSLILFCPSRFFFLPSPKDFQMGINSTFTLKTNDVAISSGFLCPSLPTR